MEILKDIVIASLPKKVVWDKGYIFC